MGFLQRRAVVIGVTYASYGDPNNAFSFGRAGRLSGRPVFPLHRRVRIFSPGVIMSTGGNCALNTAAGQTPMAPAMGFTVSSGGRDHQRLSDQVIGKRSRAVLFPDHLHVYRRDQRLNGTGTGQYGGDWDHQRTGGEPLFPARS